MVNGLPLDGALARSHDPDRMGRGWTIHHEFQAIQIELLDALYRHFLKANFKMEGPEPKPIYIPRPDDSKRSKVRPPNKPGELKRYLASKGIIVAKAKKKEV